MLAVLGEFPEIPIHKYFLINIWNIHIKSNLRFSFSSIVICLLNQNISNTEKKFTYEKYLSKVLYIMTTFSLRFNYELRRILVAF